MSRVIVIIACLIMTPAASARDMTGRLGIGGQLVIKPSSGEPELSSSALSVKYWVSELGLQALFAVETQHSGEGVTGYLEWRPGIRLLYAMTRARLTNFVFGAGISSTLRRSDDDGGNRGYFDAMFGVEHFLATTFAVGGEISLAVELNERPEVLTPVLGWSASFHYYF